MGRNRGQVALAARVVVHSPELSDRHQARTCRESDKSGWVGSTVRRMRVTGEGGVGIEVFVDGPDDGVPVLFMHGWPDTHDLWRHQVAALAADGYRTIAPDLRGFGASDKPQDVDAYQLKNTVFDMLAVLDAT